MKFSFFYKPVSTPKAQLFFLASHHSLFPVFQLLSLMSLGGCHSQLPTKQDAKHLFSRC